MPRWISTLLPATPPSVNELPLDTGNWRYRKVRDAWIQDVCYAFNEAGNVLPRRLGVVRAHAVLTFPTQRRRDSGNFKALIEKWLADALQHSRRIADDTHDLFSFGELVILVDRDARSSHFVIIDYEEQHP